LLKITPSPPTTAKTKEAMAIKSRTLLIPLSALNALRKSPF
jgi:hypothetical protein